MSLNPGQVLGDQANRNDTEEGKEALGNGMSHFSSVSPYESLGVDQANKEQKFRLHRPGSEKMLWDWAGVVFAIYSAIVVPFVVAFYSTLPIAYISVDLAVDIYFTLDFFAIFWSIRSRAKEEKLGLIETFKFLFQSILCFDILSAFPIDKALLLTYPPSSSAVIVFELFKILRIRRLSYISKNRVSVLNRIIQKFLTFLIFLHVMGCIWFIIVSIQGTWVPYQDLSSHQTVLYTTDLWSQYFICLYEGIWLVFGQDIVPRSLLEIWFSCFSICFGLIFMTYLFVEILMILSRPSLRNKFRKRSLDFCLSMTDKIHVPSALKQAILNYIINIYPSLSPAEEFRHFFKYVSPNLQQKVLREIYRPILITNELFEYDPSLSEFLLSRLRYQFYLPEQEIVVEGTRAYGFFILAKGLCNVFVKTREGKKASLGFLGEGKHFGEIGLIYKTYRTATVVSHTYSTVAQLEKAEFRTLTHAFPYVVDKLRELVLTYNDPWKSFIVNSLNQSRVFDTLPSRVVQELVYKMKILKLQPGDFLFKFNEPITGIYLITSGSLHITTPLFNKSHPNFRSSIKTRLSTRMEKDGFAFDTASKNYHSNHLDDSVIEEMHPSTLEIGTLTQGTLLYPRTGLKHDILHKLDSKAKESTTLCWIDRGLIDGLAKESDDFKKFLHNSSQPDYFEFLTPGVFHENSKFLFRKNVVKAIFLNREERQMKKNRFKEMGKLLKAVVACEHAGNPKLAELVLKNKIPYKYITAEGTVDLAYLYDGCLPSSNPVLKAFDVILSKTYKGSLLSQCGSLQHELEALVPKVKTFKQRISNSIELMNTLISQVK